VYVSAAAKGKVKAMHAHRHHALHSPHNRGGKMEDDRYIEFYVYNASFGNIASAASSQQQLQVQADSDFEVRKMTFIAEPHGGTAPFLDNYVPELGLMITDGGSGRQLFSSAVPISSVAGSGRLPFIWPVTYIFEAKATIILVVNNFSVAGSGGGALQWDNVYLSLIGNKIWKYGR
jgi:hypothetical protein